MTLSPFSCIMAVLWFTIFVAIAELLRRKMGFVFHYHVGSLLILMSVCIIRLFLPIELPFAYLIEDEYFLPILQSTLCTPFFVVKEVEISILTIAAFVWFIGAVHRVFLMIKNQYRDSAFMSALYPVEAEHADVMLRALADRTRPHQPYRLIVTPDVMEPYTLGIFRPTILLPAEDASSDRLQNILFHEWQHILNGDQIVRLLIEILRCLMWFNPITVLLKRNLDEGLELLCDSSVVKGMTEKEEISYFRYILDIAARAVIMKSMASGTAM